MLSDTTSLTPKHNTQHKGETDAGVGTCTDNGGDKSISITCKDGGKLKGNIPNKKSVRCYTCRKKIGMLVFTCNCSSELKFCSSHVQPESHKCTFDHKSLAIERLSSTLPKVVHDKVIRI